MVRSSWLFGPTGHNFVRTMLRLGAERDEVAVVADQRGCPTYVGHLAAATRELVDAAPPFGVWHLAAAGDCTWADFAEAIFEEAGLDCRVRPDHDGRVRRAGAAAGRTRSCAARRAPASCRTGATGLARLPRRELAADQGRADTRPARRVPAARAIGTDADLPRRRRGESALSEDEATRTGFLTTWLLDVARRAGLGRDLRHGRVASVVAGDRAAWTELVRAAATASAASPRFTFRSTLPYDLVFDMRSVRVERHRLLEGVALG